MPDHAGAGRRPNLTCNARAEMIAAMTILHGITLASVELLLGCSN